MQTPLNNSDTVMLPLSNQLRSPPERLGDIECQARFNIWINLLNFN